MRADAGRLGVRLPLNRRGLVGVRAGWVLLCLTLLQLCLGLPFCGGEERDGQQRLGERLYRHGVLPSGEPLTGSGSGENSAPGTAYACVSCHLRSGFGMSEMGTTTPAINGASLFRPFQMRYMRYGFKNRNYFPTPITRPAYTDATLAEAIRNGIDPAGRGLDLEMPRYPLNDPDMAILVSYLKGLSSGSSPGVTESAIRLATVVSDDVSGEEREAMLAGLRSFIEPWNNRAAYQRQLAGSGKLRMFGNVMPPPGQSLSLSLWLVKGAPETWRSQLDDYYRKEPVFALVGGISKSEWKPVHDFCEELGIPSIFPNTYLPVISATDWYTLYLSRGHYGEGEAVARYLDSLGKTGKGDRVMQIVRDSREGRALSAGFEETWKALGHSAPETVKLKEGELLQGGAAQRELAKVKPTTVLLWDGATALAELEALATGKESPQMFFLSSRYVGKDLWTLKESLRDITYITYPQSLKASADTSRPSPGFSPQETENRTELENQLYAVSAVLPAALADMKGSLYRDNLLDAIGAMEDIALSEGLTFGAAERYASIGCDVVRLSKGQGAGASGTVAGGSRDTTLRRPAGGEYAEKRD